ncbi:threonyl-tRNA aminoacylation [Aureococcus anophagefferens]|nr:threonyl-tRNA aminoacylation [Aureococcus anophagefferens]
MAPPALQKTGKFSVFDRPGVKQTQRTSGARLTTASAGKIDQAAGEKIGGPFAVEPAPAFTAHREAFADEGSGDEADDEQSDVVKPVLWDLPRPLEGDCRLELLDFESPEGKMVFWHSAAHLLGAALEQKYGAKLSIGPPVEGGFYYDAYIGNETISDKEFKDIQARVAKIVNAKVKFERLALTKAELLDMFAYNPFKSAIIQNKVPDGAMTTAYRSGPIIDLCMGPQVPDAGRVKAFEVLRASSAYWLGKTENDTLQRVYGKLFFFDQLSPGSAFFEPHGARIYNGLIAFIKDQYWLREYTEVVTPNVYNFDLWHTSGHALHYKDDMFCFDVEGAEFGMKPMNCPGHCLMFKHDVRSWRDLPMRYADFGVLHRNELSGALSGLTRVRRFQQDDGHIFCREDQVEEELSTRPKKALGDKAVWDRAEAALASAMDAFAGKGGWRVNPGDGAFYGPKIDIKVTDALERVHQCATIQLDFQLPIRFDLKYRVGDTAGDEAGSVTRPIIIHRAMLGSVERMMAVLTEHWGGKWPFWISPRQVCVIPVGPTNFDYARAVRKTIRAARFFLAQYNFILVVGDNEVSDGTVTVRTRANTVEGTVPLADFVARCRVLQDTQAKDPPPPEQPAKGAAPAKGNKK